MKKYSFVFMVALLASVPFALSEDATDADNTARNKENRAASSLTPVDQSNKPEDIKLTQVIRKRLMDDTTLSTNAKNIKVITIDGKVTLRGTAKDASEKEQISRLVKEAAGPAPVSNHIEVKAKPTNP